MKEIKPMIINKKNNILIVFLNFFWNILKFIYILNNNLYSIINKILIFIKNKLKINSYKNVK